MLSKRLETISGKVKIGTRTVGDIGTDHGFIPIFLVKSGICEKAVASDINDGPINIANSNIKKVSLEHLIETRKGPGLTVFSPGEMECYIIAGMGGILIKDILNDSMEVVKSADYFILQPVQNANVLREYLIDNGFRIYDEEIVYDMNKYYQIICVDRKKSDKALYDLYSKEALDFTKKLNYIVGPKLIENRDKLLTEFLLSELNKSKKVYKEILKKGTEKSSEKLKECSNYIDNLNELINILQ